MKPPPFSYHDPETLEQAVALLATLDNAKVLAGGQSLMPMLNMRFVLPDHVVDLNRVTELSGIRREGDTLVIGAMTRQRELEFNPDIAADCPMMAEALTYVGHRQTRNRGTIGGSLCHLDPAAELACVSAALDAIVEVTGPNGRRDIPFATFPAGYMTPSIDFTELVTGIRVPVWPSAAGHSFVEFSRRHGDFAIVSAGAILLLDASGTITRAALALGGVGAVPLRMHDVEAALVGQVASADLFRRVSAMCRAVEAVGDVYVPASYRQHLACVMARRALQKAFSRAGSTAAPN